MNKLLLATLGLSTALISPITAHAQEICAVHTVVEGDKLRIIAAATYGSEDDYRYIYAANRAKLGLSPHALNPGMTLDLPCEHMLAETAAIETPKVETAPIEVAADVNAEPEPSSETAAPMTTVALPAVPVFSAPLQPSTDTRTTAEERARAEAAEEARAKADTLAEAEVQARIAAAAAAAAQGAQNAAPDLIGLVGFADNPPYSDPELLTGGLITTLIYAALIRGGAGEIAQPDYIDRAAIGMATDTLPYAFHLSYPWLLPDCSLIEFDRDIADLCANYTFSAPIYEAQMAMFSTKDSLFSTASKELDLVGARICRPASMHTYDLLKDGMTEPMISLETAKDLATCFDDLQEGLVDIVSVNGLTADVYFNAEGNRIGIVELSELATIHTVHAIARKDDIEGNNALELLNSGLWDMFSSGEWGTVAKEYLSTQFN